MKVGIYRRQLYEVIIDVNDTIESHPLGIGQTKIAITVGVSSPKVKPILAEMIKNKLIERRKRLYFPVASN